MRFCLLGDVRDCHRYAEQVAGGKIITSKLVRLACERHLRDLERGHERGLRFDESRARHALEWFDFLRHSKGKWGNAPFSLQPWQKFVIGSLFGWLNDRGFRRFRTAYKEVPRKNGKSTLISGIGTYLTLADNEPGAEVYAAATKLAQAKIVFDEAKRMVRKSPHLSAEFQPFKNSLYVPWSESKFEPLGSDSDTLDGLNVHGALIDELHRHKSPDLYDVLDTATGAREQSLILSITTAGAGRHSKCWEMRSYCEQLLLQLFDDDSVFAYIAGADPEDDWRDPRVWEKANPNWGISVSPEDLHSKFLKAKRSRSAELAFKRLHLNLWIEQFNRWLDLEKWDRCRQDIDRAALRNVPGYAGLDVSVTTDLTALALVFETDRGLEDIPFFWLPEETIDERSESDNVPYRQWCNEGYIEVTPGAATDFALLEQRILEISQEFKIREWSYDKWNAVQLAQGLTAKGLRMVEHRQNFSGMNLPSKHLESRIAARTFIHDGHPVLRWNALNVVVESDSAGNIKPHKKKSAERIDCIVATINAIGAMLIPQPETPNPYATGDLLLL